MRNFTLLERYKFAQKVYGIAMPLISVILFIVAVIMFIIRPNIPWLGVIFLVMTVLTIVIYFFIRKYLNKKITELESENSKTD